MYRSTPSNPKTYVFSNSKTSWDQHFEALEEYKRKFGTWVVNPNSAGDDPVSRKTFEALKDWISYQQVHTQNMTQEQRLKWSLLTGQRIPRNKTSKTSKTSKAAKASKASKPHQHRPAAVATTATAAAATTTTAAATYKYNTPTAPTTTTDASLWSRYRTKGVGLSQMQWNSMFDKLLAFRKVHGHVNVPVRFKADPKLGKWVSRQRESRITMAEERRSRLNAIGFSWTQKRLCHQQSPQWQDGTNRNRKTYDKQWNARYQQLLKFHRQYGHTLVETGDLAGIIDGPDEMDKFRRWVSKQRALGGRGELREDRDAMLRKLGFWKDGKRRAAMVAAATEKLSALLGEDMAPAPPEVTSMPSTDSNNTTNTDTTPNNNYNDNDEAPPADEAVLAAPISKEAVEIATLFYKKEAAKEKKMTTTNRKKVEKSGVSVSVENQLPPLQVPAHVKRMQTLQYFQYRRALEDQERGGGGGGGSKNPAIEMSFEEQMRRKYLGGGNEDYHDDEEEDEEENSEPEKEEEVHYGEDNYDSSEDEDLAQAAAEKILREAIEASELSQRQKAEQSLSFSLAPASVSKPKAPTHILMTSPSPAVAATAAMVEATPQQNPSRPIVTPSPGAFVPVSVPVPPPPSSHPPRSYYQASYPKAPAPIKKIAYHRVNKEIQSFDDAFVKMMDAKAPDWKRKRRWSYVCM